jgi:hypothetical protein
MAEAGGVEWGDATKISLLKRGLRLDLREKLIGNKLPSEYFLWIDRVGEIAGELEQLERDIRRSPPKDASTNKVKGRDKRKGKPERSDSSRASPNPHHHVDTEGDTKMTGINRTHRDEPLKNRGRSRGRPTRKKSPDRHHRRGENGHRRHNRERSPSPPPTLPVMKSRVEELSSDSEDLLSNNDSEKEEL